MLLKKIVANARQYSVWLNQSLRKWKDANIDGAALAATRSPVIALFWCLIKFTTTTTTIDKRVYYSNKKNYVMQCDPQKIIQAHATKTKKNKKKRKPTLRKLNVGIVLPA